MDLRVAGDERVSAEHSAFRLLDRHPVDFDEGLMLLTRNRLPVTLGVRDALRLGGDELLAGPPVQRSIAAALPDNPCVVSAHLR